MVVPNGTLFGDGVAARIKEELLREFNLHTVVRLPNGVFAPYTSIPTNMLFFDRSGADARGLVLRAAAAGGAQEVHARRSRCSSRSSRSASRGGARGRRTSGRGGCRAESILANGCNLDLKNPRAKQDVAHLPPEQLAASILAKEQRIAEIVADIQRLLAEGVR